MPNMQNPDEFNQQIQALQRELQKEIEEVKQKENALHETTAKTNQFKENIKNDDTQIHQKQQEILRLQQDMEARKRDIVENEKNINRLKGEMERIKLMEIQKNNQVGDLTRKQKDALARQNLKDKKQP
jgi:hypothetical protein